MATGGTPYVPYKPSGGGTPYKPSKGSVPYKPGSGGTPYRKAAIQRVRGRYTTDSKGQRTYHAPEESTTYGPEGGRSVPVKPTEASRFPNKRY